MDESPDDLVAVWLGALGGATWWEVDADEPVHAASLMKVPVATAAQRRHERGELDLDGQVPVHPDFDSIVAGERFELSEDGDQDPTTWAEIGSEQTLRELRRRSLVHSGNLATNLVLERVGIAEVGAVLADAGGSDRTVLPRGISDQPATEAGLLNVVTARDLARLLAHTPEPVEQVMRGQTYRNAIPAGLPAGTLVANKTGWVDGITHDMAIVRPDGATPFALVVLTRLADVSHEEANQRIAVIATEAWDRRP